MSEYKVLVSDYDGTLANSNNDISKENLSAINDYISRGGIFVLSSGRATDGISKILIKQGFKGLLSSFNGAVLYDLTAQKILASKCVTNDLCKRFAKYASEHGLYYHFYGETGFLFPFETARTSLYENLTGVKGKRVEDMQAFFEQTSMETPKILIFDDENKLDDNFDALTQLLPECEVVRSTENMIDINLKGVNKGYALTMIGEHFNTPVSTLIAVGDAGNDIAMIERAGLSFAVSNATQEIKQVADIVLPVSNDENAVKYIIENYLT
ncbi:MAG: HAD family phosphatase [Clostridia bacterium]|nr:HAD family phosphatase [Clostridia bacterium]